MVPFIKLSSWYNGQCNGICSAVCGSLEVWGGKTTIQALPILIPERAFCKALADSGHFNHLDHWLSNLHPLIIGFLACAYPFCPIIDFGYFWGT